MLLLLLPVVLQCLKAQLVISSMGLVVVQISSNSSSIQQLVLPVVLHQVADLSSSSSSSRQVSSGRITLTSSISNVRRHKNNNSSR